MPSKAGKKKGPNVFEKETGHAKTEVVYVDIDDPDHDTSIEDGKQGNRLKSRAAINMRESPLVLYFYRDGIDAEQLQAGNEFRRKFEIAGGAGVKAFDYSVEFVDGGKSSDGLTQAKVNAAKGLAEVRSIMREMDYILLHQICGECRTIKQIFPDITDYRHRQQMEHLRKLLDEVCFLWGYKARQRKAS